MALTVKQITPPQQFPGSDPCATMLVLLEVGFSMWSTLRLCDLTDPVQFTSVFECSAVECSEESALVKSQSVGGLLQLEAGS